MEALGDLEEGLVAVDHDPLGVHPTPAGVSDKGMEHLCDASTDRRGAKVPHSATSQCHPRLFCSLDELVEARLSDDTSEALRSDGGHHDGTRSGHFPILA